MTIVAKILSIFSTLVFKQKSTTNSSMSSRSDATLQIVSQSQIESGRSSAYNRLLP